MLKQALLIIAVLMCITSFAQTSDYKIKTIVLDAGHGGHDTGCQGVSSYEKNVTLAIVLKLGALIQKTYPDVKVIYTRKTDEFIELYERADIANRNNADLFISIHCNANSNTSAYGTETWLMGLHKSEENLEVSKRENDVVLLEDNYQQNYDGFDPNSPEGFIILSMNQNAHLDQSIDLASKVENAFTADGRNSRGVKQAGFLVLWRTTMPSILIETGFLTNPKEEKYLNSADGQNEIAQSVLESLTQYKNEVEGTGMLTANNDSNVSAGAQQPNTTTDNVYYPVGYNTPPNTTGSNTTSTKTTTTNNKTTSSSTTTTKTTPSAPSSSNTTTTSSQTTIDASVNTDGMIYRVQFYASPNVITKKDPKFSFITDEIFTEKNEKGMIRYMVGSYTSLADADKRKDAMRKHGFTDAFVIGYKEGKRIQLN